MKQNELSDKLARSVAEFYEAHGAAFSSTRHAPWGVMQLVKDAVKPGDVLVDVGAGNGRLGLEIPDSVRYVAIEPSSALRQAAAKILADRQNTEIMDGGFSVGATHALPLPDASADVVACLAVQHHIPAVESRRVAVAELSRILKPGGTLVLTVWNLRSPRFFRNRSWFERLKILAAAWLRLPLVGGGVGGDVWVSWKAGGADAKRYVHAFTLGELESLFDPRIWEVRICEAWNNREKSNILGAKNLVLKANKKL